FNPPEPLAPVLGVSDASTRAVRAEAAGDFATGIHWAAVQGRVSRSVPELVRDLETQDARKSDRDNNMTLTPVPDPTFLARQEVHFSFKPLPLVEVEWTETWAYAVTRGTVDQPETVVVAYEKTRGTSYIPHLCGSVFLQARGPHSTEVTWYEEVKATRRSAADTLNGIRATLRKLHATATTTVSE
ncbi:MAG TPA: hypothetical protein VFH51_18915, partial [Myxococcota bacterium]|nr:hypothetical protein [Myxococcota bacterium]